MKYVIIMFLISIQANSLMIRYSSDTSNSYVFDTTTKLMWEDTVNVKSELTWTEAKLRCSDLDMSSFDDWRAPSFNELSTLADDTKSLPALSDVFIKYISGSYWSSTTSAVSNDFSKAWIIDFIDGGQENTSKKGTLPIRCVRSSE